MASVFHINKVGRVRPFQWPKCLTLGMGRHIAPNKNGPPGIEKPQKPSSKLSKPQKSSRLSGCPAHFFSLMELHKTTHGCLYPLKKKRFNLNIIQSRLQTSVHSCMKSSHTRLRLFVLRVKNPIYSCNLRLQEVNWVNFALSGPCPRIWGLPVPFKAGFERTWSGGFGDTETKISMIFWRSSQL